MPVTFRVLVMVGSLLSVAGAGAPATLSTDTATWVAGIASDAARPLGLQVRRRSALLTTKTELKPMAAAPIIGLSVTPQGESTPAATGMQMAL